jgi:hypothetical protein
VVTNVIRLPAPTSSATFRALAADRHRLAVHWRTEGERLGNKLLVEYAAKLMRDVKLLDELAHVARLREQRLEDDRRRRNG